MLARCEGVDRPASELLTTNDVVHDIFLPRDYATRTGDCELLLL